jgi:hypothetical protein
MKDDDYSEATLLAHNVGGYVDVIRDKYEKERRPTDPPTFEERHCA